ncbi:MAG: serine/threonine-protein kinase [Microscillaceae bacterium]|nr:serine/threonine-protein kinase [Microscillaceae bacterium]
MTGQSIIANYQLKRILGKGGMGTVYLAQHTQIDRKVAIKELKPEYARDPAIRIRFKNEAALMANLRHPNIVSLHDYLETPNGVYLIMEYVEGISLDHYIHQVSGPVPESKAIEVFVQVLDAVEYAHRRNIVHRDIKPSNMMITQDGSIKILDFGIAKHIDTPEKGLTQTGIRMGTIFYMSPEQVLAREVDARTDIYSLGITLFEILTGTNPYQSDLSEYEINTKIVQEPLPKARSFYPNVSDRMQSILEKATAKNPNDRFQSAAEFKAALLNDQKISRIQSSENTVEWIIRKNPENGIGEKPVFEKNFLVQVTDKEFLLLDNSFGMVTNHKLMFYKGKDLFEKGERNEIPLHRIISSELNTHRETTSGIISLIIAITVAWFYLHFLTILMGVILLVFSVLCFFRFPTVTLVLNDWKKVKMKSWPWDIHAASRYVMTVRDQINKN